MSSPVRILGVTHVTVPEPDTAARLREPMVRLSAMDALWLTLPLIQRVLIFVDSGEGSIPPFASLLDSLRASLAPTLARFLPLAGRLVFLPPSGDVAVDCSAAGGVSGCGVRFVAAECLGADTRRLAGDADHDAEAFGQLVPALHAGVLPAETLAVQATRLDGGVALGVAIHHAVVDGRSVFYFLRAWAAECRGEPPEEPPPTFDRAALRLPGGDDLVRSVLRKYAPNLPQVTDMPNYLVKARKPGVELSRRTLVVSGRDIRRLKQRIEDMDARRPRPRLAQPPSSFVALAALAWTSHIRSKLGGSVSPDDDVYLFFFADCRGRLDPPVEERYFGACIVGCLANSAARDLLAEDGVSAAAAAAQAEILRAAEEPLARWDWMATAMAIPLERTLSVSGSARFPAYEGTDFGWGPPARTELATMRRDGQVVLVGGRGVDGGVQVSVALHATRIDVFESHFRSWLQ